MAVKPFLLSEKTERPPPKCFEKFEIRPDIGIILPTTVRDEAGVRPRGRCTRCCRDPCVRLVRRENIPARPASDWSV
eukprot:1187461-Prorocentrum_minimum.AAC.3